MNVNEPLSIYLHIPFCTTKCTYCAFNTYTNLEALVPEFVAALNKEIAYIGNQGQSNTVKSVFFGGGTPSLLTPAQYESVFDALRSAFLLLPDAEITLEANPNDLSLDYCRQLVKIGFNRISLGMQSVNANELRLFARRHDNDAVARAVSAARQGGFRNLNLDLIYGVPHQTLESWQTTLSAAIALNPEHLSLYALGLEEGTPMKVWVEKGRLPEPDDDLAADMYDLATQLLSDAGYEQYEISNWSRPGFRCHHNLQYWYNLPYLGFGPGAHGFADHVRYAVVASPQRYIRLLREEIPASRTFPLTPAVETSSVLDRASEISETLIMWLRLTQNGVERDSFRTRFGEDLLNVYGDVIDKYQKGGLLEVTEDHVRLTDRGRLLSNMIFRELV